MAGQAKAKVRASSREVESGALDPSHAKAEEGSDSASPDLGQRSAAPNEVELVQHAADVLGVGHVPAWMRSQIPSLDGATPYSLMHSGEGRRRVEKVLLQTEHGVY
jgi:uncharacterized protein (DUF2384 family)